MVYLLKTLFSIMFHLVRNFPFYSHLHWYIENVRFFFRMYIVDLKSIGPTLLCLSIRIQCVFCLKCFNGLRIIEHGNGEVVERSFPPFFFFLFISHSFMWRIESKKSTLIPIHLARGTSSTDFRFTQNTKLTRSLNFILLLSR